MTEHRRRSSPLLRSLQMKFNRMRQAAITNERTLYSVLSAVVVHVLTFHDSAATVVDIITGASGQYTLVPCAHSISRADPVPLISFQQLSKRLLLRPLFPTKISSLPLSLFFVLQLFFFPFASIRHPERIVSNIFVCRWYRLEEQGGRGGEVLKNNVQFPRQAKIPGSTREKSSLPLDLPKGSVDLLAISKNLSQIVPVAGGIQGPSSLHHLSASIDASGSSGCASAFVTVSGTGSLVPSRQVPRWWGVRGGNPDLLVPIQDGSLPLDMQPWFCTPLFPLLDSHRYVRDRKSVV